MAVFLVGGPLLAYLTLLAAAAGSPPKAAGQCALGLGVVSVAFALRPWAAAAAARSVSCWRAHANVPPQLEVCFSVAPDGRSSAPPTAASSKVEHAPSG